MTMNTLRWTVEDGGLTFQVMAGDGQPQPVDLWGALALQAEGRPASAGPLLALLEDGAVNPRADGSVAVPHELAARWDGQQVQQLGLPEVAPYRLNIRGQGVLSSPGFRFVFQLQDRQGRPPMGARRQGVILTVGRRRNTVLAPVYALIEGMERYNAAPEQDMDARFAVWAELQTLLPEDALVDGHLRSLNIARADAFTLDSTADDAFAPLLLGHPARGTDEVERNAAASPEAVLPAAGQREFADRFQRLDHAQRRYALPGNWYVMVSEPLRQALQVVREVLDAPPAERRGFLADPHAYLKTRLEGRVTAEVVDALFEETPAFLSARVHHLGEWSPKAHAFVGPSAIEWVPSEETGAPAPPSPPPGPDTPIQVPTHAGLVKVEVAAVPELLEALRTAQADGRDAVDWNGQSVPADADTIAAFEGLAGPKGKGVVGPALVPIILDNLESVEYQAPPRPTAGPAGGLPAVLVSQLYPHQRAGLEWLQAHWAAGSRGALLADDMGLGKTVQTLAFLAWVQEQTRSGDGGRKPHLIVAPTGLLKNWEAESAIHLASPGLGRRVRAYGADLRELAGRPALQRRAFLEEQADWVLTTYETLRDKVRLFVDVPWRVVVFDEAQKIKNPASRMTDMAKSLAADFTLALSGTPVENALSDLWCIVDTVHPGLLGSHAEFRKAYVQPAKRTPEAAAPIKDKLEQETRPALLLRRMKEDHLRGLPEKHAHREARAMPEAQGKAYDRVVAGARASVGQDGGKPGAMLEALHGLRQVSLLPEPPGADGITDAVVRDSARLTVLMEILDRVHRQGEKALVFLEFLGLQEALIPYLRQRYALDWDPLRIHGGIPGARRQAHVDTFQSRPQGVFDLMLLSPKAAGVGLTLTAANHVIHLSRWWNPAVEDQCTDRVYRIGQDRDVHVHYPIAVHPTHGERSFDLNLHRLLEKKRDLSRSVLAPPVAGDDDLNELLSSSIG